MKHTVCIFATVVTSMHCLATASEQPCGQVTVGYPDQERLPFVIGKGSVVPAHPGAAIELIRATLEARHCTVSLVRLPEARLRPALASGDIDLAPVTVDEEASYPFAIPTQPDGTRDMGRTLALDVVVYVRQEDQIPSKILATQYFADRTLGANLGAPPVALLRRRGLRIDDGALDIWRNLEKLRLRRVDGVVIVSTSDGRLDAKINSEFKGSIVRLGQPILSLHYTLGASPALYKEKPLLIQAIWDDIGKHWQRQFQARVKQYPHTD